MWNGKKQQRRRHNDERNKTGNAGIPFSATPAGEETGTVESGFELLFLLRGRGRVSYEDGEVHNLPMGSIFAINRFQICDLDLDEDGLALSLCVSAETIASFHIKLLKCEVKCQSFFIWKISRKNLT